MVANLLSNNPDWNQMRFSQMHTFITWKKLRHQVELEAARVLKAVADQSQSAIVITQGKRKAKNNKSAKEKAP